MWLKVLGVHLVVLWQLMQLPLVGMCVADLPVADVPLWQLEQLVDALNRL